MLFWFLFVFITSAAASYVDRFMTVGPGVGHGTNRQSTNGQYYHVHNGNFYISSYRMTDEERLLYHLFNNYDRNSRPLYNLNKAVVVSMSLTLTQIFELDEKNQVLVTNVWLNLEWYDEYLSWRPNEYSSMEVVRMNSSKLWLPDVVLYNNAAQYSAKDRQLYTRAMVKNDGLVFWSTPKKLYSSCKIDVTYFPFDQQLCVMKFGSWTYDGFKIDLVNSSASADLTFYEKSGEWDLISAEQRRNVVVYTCCVEPYPDVSFCVQIRRKTLYYVLNVFFPCFLMSTLTLLIFQLPTRSGEKCGLGVTIMLSFAVYMLTVIKKLPETSDSFPLISIYLTAVLSMTAISVCCTVGVLSLDRRPTRAVQLPWLLRTCLNFAGPLCCVHRQPPFWMNESYPVVAKITPRQFLDELSRELTQMTHNKHQRRRSDQNGDAVGLIYSNLLTGISRIIDRHSHEAEDTSVRIDWARLAEYVDKCLFWMLLLLIGSFTLWILAFYAPEKQLPEVEKCQWLPENTA